ncbi:MAG: endolytic transglycosylase MltG [Bacillota bacterium]
MKRDAQDWDGRTGFFHSSTWLFIRPIAIFLISAALVVGCFVVAIHYVFNEYILPVDINDPTPVTVVIENASSAATIAKVLYEACGEGQEGLIANKAVFKIYVDFVGKASKLKAGTYVLSKNMDIPQIVDELCKGNPAKRTLRFTITEGSTVEDIANTLVKAGVLTDTAEVLALCKDAAEFETFSFVKEIPVNPEQARDYELEGYLFPDTYDVFEGSSAETVITKLLLRFHEVFTDDYIERAQTLNMTIDDVIALASMIEKEAKTPDFKKVSAVFHNRLNKGDTLGSDAGIQYIYKEKTLLFTDEQLKNPSLYNTRLHKGLPLGPISNPGKAAIEAALYPDTEYMEQGYYYFCLKDPKTGELVYAKTLKEHEKNVEKYKSTWS